MMEKEAQFATRLRPFNPSVHGGETAKEFAKFLRLFKYKYWATDRKAPTGEVDADAWEQKDMWKQLMGNYATDRFLDDINAVTTDPRKVTFDEMEKLLLERYQPTQNTTMSHFNFHRLQQKADQTFDDFVNEIKIAAKYCEFNCTAATCTVADILIRDQIIIGVKDDEFRKEALQKQWKLKEVETEGRRAEAAAIGAAIIGESSDAKVDKVKAGKYSRKKRMMENKDNKKTEKVKFKCHTCGRDRCNWKKCPAKTSSCRKCGQKGHWAESKRCPENSKEKTAKKNAKASRVCETSSSAEDTSSTDSEDSEKSSDNEAYAHSVLRKPRVFKIGKTRKQQRSRRPRRDFGVQVAIKGKMVSVNTDTGAEINVLPLSEAKRLNLPIYKSRLRIHPYGGKPFRVLGKYEGTTTFGESVVPAIWYIVKKKLEPLLSGELAERLGVIEFNGSPVEAKVSKLSSSKSSSKDNDYYFEKFPKVFKGVGTLKGYKVHLHIDKSVKSIAEPPRPIPFHLKKRFQDEIKKMEEDKIIEEHSGPSPWVSNVVLAPKENGLRITVDMRNANNSILQTHIPIPRVEDIKTQLAGSRYFSKLDFRSAFHQLELDEESKEVTVFNADGRLMRYRKLTMGNSVATGELNKALRPLLSSIKHTHIIHDDVIIAAPTKKEHDKAVTEVLTIIENSGLTLNPEKCCFNVKEMSFWGLKVTDEGLKPDPLKVQALQEADSPKSKEELVSFLCMIQSNSEFIPNLSKHTANLRELTNKNRPFKWTSVHEKEFNHIKDAFSQDALLRFYDPDKKTFIFVDAHKKGLGAILSQGESIEEALPIAIASRTTTKVEKKYPQIDLEGMAVDFGLRRFRQYLVGGPEITIITDHKPLLGVFGKRKLGSIRLDRIKLRHQDIKYKLEWRKGTANPADYLSRHGQKLERLSKEIKEETEEFGKLCWFIHTSPYIETITIKQIQEETRKCDILQDLKRQIKKGFIRKKDKHLQPYHRVFDELTISDGGLILRGERILLPPSLIKIAVTRAHQGGHPGETNLKRRIRSHFWFPGINEAVKEKLRKCIPCQSFTEKTTKEPHSILTTHKRAWEQVALDLFGPLPSGKHIFVAQDTVSKFPAAKIIADSKASTVIPVMDEIYSSFGYPEKHVTDNGPPFNSQSFKEYSISKGIKHQKGFPHHPQSNPVERLMKPLGKAIKASIAMNEHVATSLNKFLVGYRDTPHVSTNISPGDYLLRDGYHADFPRKKPITDKKINEGREKEINRKEAIQQKTNQSIKIKEDKFKVGDQVLLRNMNRKSKYQPKYLSTIGVVTELKEKGLKVRDQQGRVFIRHKDDVKHCYFKGADRKEKQRKMQKEHLEQVADDRVTIPSNGHEKDDVEAVDANRNDDARVADGSDDAVEEIQNDNTIQQNTTSPTPVLRRSKRNTARPKKYNDYEM